MADSRHDWLRLDPGEAVRWESRPRLVPVLLWVGFLLAATVAAVVAAVVVEPLIALAVPLGPAVAAWLVLDNRRTWFVLTTDGIYVRRGVLGISVRTVEYDRVQNSAYSQSITGSLFGHGTVEVDVAGGEDVTLYNIYDPDEVESTITRQVRTTRDEGIPGTVEQWTAIRDELRALRRALESR